MYFFIEIFLINNLGIIKITEISGIDIVTKNSSEYSVTDLHTLCVN